MTGPIKPKKIMIVEDNNDNRELLVKILNSTPHVVVEAKDGREALEIAELEQPDLIFMDLSIPYVDGFEVTRRLKQREDMKNTKIVALSGSVINLNSDLSRELGWDGYLLKPVSIKKIITTVDEQLN